MKKKTRTLEISEELKGKIEVPKSTSAGSILFHETCDKEYCDYDDIKKKYYELLYAVQTKIPNETRHETALRYIMRAEVPYHDVEEFYKEDD